MLRAAQREYRGQLHHQVRAGVQRPTRPRPRIGDGGFAALHECARERDYDRRIAKCLAHGLDLGDMSLMQRVIFGDNAYDFGSG